MGWRLSPALEQLRREVDAAHPGRSKVSDGTIGDPAHAARESDHNPNAAGIVRAWDITADEELHVAQAVVDFLLEHQPARVKYLIWRGHIASGPGQGHPPWQWRPYTGPNGHYHHAHLSVQSDGGAPWGYPAPTTEELDMLDTDNQKIIRRLIGEELDARLDPDGKGNLLVRIRDSAAKTEDRTKRALTKINELLGRG